MNTDKKKIVREVKLTHDDFIILQQITLINTGILFSEDKEQIIYNRLYRRVRELGYRTFQPYCDLVSGDIHERSIFINLITNHSTSFFREHHHFDYLKKYIFPELFKSKRKIRIWSAGCATGEEPYSIAIAMHEMNAQLDHYDIKILATDINTDALTVAERGVYDIKKIAHLSRSRTHGYFLHGVGGNTGLVKINPEIQKFVSFKYLNLINPWPFHGPFDIIFCRNVTIYFAKDMAQHLIERFDKMIKVDGVIILGHSENLYDLRKRYIPIGKTTYKKIVR